MNNEQLIELLNENLAGVKEDMRDGDLKNRPNILVLGFTADEMRTIVSDWAAANHINLHCVDARTITNDTMFGHLERDADGERRYVRSMAFDPLDRPNSVLYIDYLNLLPDLTLRSALLDIPKGNFICSDGISKKHYFSNLLFTIAREEDVTIDDPSAQLQLGEMDVFLYIVNKE